MINIDVNPTIKHIVRCNITQGGQSVLWGYDMTMTFDPIIDLINLWDVLQVTVVLVGPIETLEITGKVVEIASVQIFFLAVEFQVIHVIWRNKTLLLTFKAPTCQSPAKLLQH